MLTWIPVISPIEVKLSSSQPLLPLLPRREESVVDIEYVARDDAPPTSLFATNVRETMAQENVERTSNQWRDKIEATQKRLKGEE